MIATIPLRRLANERSEMVSQILFGEVVEVLQIKEKDWALVRCAWDGYLGWLNIHQLVSIEEKEFQKYTHCKSTAAEVLGQALLHDESRFVPFGASLHGFDEMTFQMGKDRFSYSGRASMAERIEDQKSYLRKMALRLLYAPYLWGGRSPLGIDCSGFVQVLFKHIGVQLPRDAYQQIEIGTPVDFVSAAEVGDLAFFRSPYSDKISHVGMVLEKSKIIHASAYVRIDRLDHYGIFNNEQNKYTHLLVGVKRVI